MCFKCQDLSACTPWSIFKTSDDWFKINSLNKAFQNPEQ